jgi:hypothetical protein
MPRRTLILMPMGPGPAITSHVRRKMSGAVAGHNEPVLIMPSSRQQTLLLHADTLVTRNDQMIVQQHAQRL